MTDPQSKAACWNEWVHRKLLADITTKDRRDPVRVKDSEHSTFERTDAYDTYRLGRGSGEYLYMFYLLESPGEEPTDITPYTSVKQPTSPHGCWTTHGTSGTRCRPQTGRTTAPGAATRSTIISPRSSSRLGPTACQGPSSRRG